jgi:hypothetical protein
LVRHPIRTIVQEAAHLRTIAEEFGWQHFGEALRLTHEPYRSY